MSDEQFIDGATSEVMWVVVSDCRTETEARSQNFFLLCLSRTLGSLLYYHVALHIVLFPFFNTSCKLCCDNFRVAKISSLFRVVAWDEFFRDLEVEMLR